MDRTRAERTRRAGMFAAGAALFTFALAFYVTILYIA
jgi:hypothetical protein